MGNLKIEITETPSEGWKTLQRAIPDGMAKAVAHRLSVSADHVRRWRRKPLSDEAPLSTGQRSILDRTCDLVDAVWLTNKLGAALIVEHVRHHYEELVRVAAASDGEWDPRAHAASTLREAAEAVNALNLDSVSDEETILELVEARELIDQAILKLKIRRASSRRPVQEAGTTEVTESGRVGGTPDSVAGGEEDRAH